MPRGDDQKALTSAAADEFGQDHPDLEGLAEPDGVGEQHSGPCVCRVEHLADRGALIGERVGQRAGRDGERGVVQRQRGSADIDSSQTLELRYRGLSWPPPVRRPDRAGGCRRGTGSSTPGFRGPSRTGPCTWTSSPSSVCSVSRTSHSASRTTTTDPGCDSRGRPTRWSAPSSSTPRTPPGCVRRPSPGPTDRAGYSEQPTRRLQGAVRTFARGSDRYDGRPLGARDPLRTADIQDVAATVGRLSDALYLVARGSSKQQLARRRSHAHHARDRVQLAQFQATRLPDRPAR